jgi:hypothetical protein
MDDSKTDRLLSDRTFNEIGCLDKEGCDINMAKDDCDEYDDQYYLEMFRRALRDHDRHAQRWLQNHFSVEVLDLMNRHPSKDKACRLHSGEYYVIETFKHFWQTSLQHHEIEFKCMTDVLYYLRVSLNSAILDTLRNHALQDDVPLLSSSIERASNTTGNGSSYEVWGIVEGKLSDARERRLAYLLFHYALKPGEVVRNCPEDFSDVHEVSRMRRDIIELLSK